MMIFEEIDRATVLDLTKATGGREEVKVKVDFVLLVLYCTIQSRKLAGSIHTLQATVVSDGWIDY